MKSKTEDLIILFGLFLIILLLFLIFAEKLIPTTAWFFKKKTIVEERIKINRVGSLNLEKDLYTPILLNNNRLVFSTKNKIYFSGVAEKKFFFNSSFFPPVKLKNNLVVIFTNGNVISIDKELRTNLLANIKDLTKNSTFIFSNKDNIFVYVNKSNLYCFNGENFYLLWNCIIPKANLFFPLEINGDNYIDLLVISNKNQLYAIDGKTGFIIFIKNFISDISLICSGNFYFKKRNEIVLLTKEGEIIILDLAGEEKMVYSMEEFNINYFSVAQLDTDPLSELLCLSTNEIFGVDNKISKILWSYKNEYKFTCKPAIFDINNDKIDDIILCDLNKNILIFSGKTGDLLLKQKLEEAVYFRPLISDLNNDKKPDISILTENLNLLRITI